MPVSTATWGEVDAATGEIIERTPKDYRRLDDSDALQEQHYKAFARVPDIDDFDESEFMQDGSLDKLAQTLIKRHNLPAQHFTIEALWKRKGGKSKGVPVWGDCHKLSGLTKYYADGPTFTITISANHAAEYQITNYQLEAILFHQLNHIGADIDEEGIPVPRIVDHDIDGFTRDVAIYGNWLPQHRKMKKAFEQMPLIPDGYLR